MYTYSFEVKTDEELKELALLMEKFKVQTMPDLVKLALKCLAECEPDCCEDKEPV